MSTGAAGPAPAPSLDSRYWRLWGAAGVSSLGDGMTAAAMPLLAASLTRDPALVAGLGVAVTLPWLLFSLVSGAMVDRMDRRKVMVAVDLFRAAVTVTLALSVATGGARIWVLYLVAFTLGTAETLFDNAAQSMLPAVVAPELLEQANGRQYTIQVVGNTFAGPPLGGFLFAATAALPLAGDAASFAVAALLVWTLKGDYRPRAGRPAAAQPRPVAAEGVLPVEIEPAPVPRTSLRTDIAEGVRWLSNHRLLRTWALMLGVLNLSMWFGMATFVLFAQDELGLSPGQFGLLLAAGAVGSVAGGVFGARIAQALGAGRALVLAVVGQAAALALIGLSSNAVVVAVLFSVLGLVALVWNIVTVSTRQQIIPDRLLGRVNSAYRMAGWGSQPLGAVIGGVLASAFGLRAPWFIGAGVILVALVIARPVMTTAAIEAAKGV